MAFHSSAKIILALVLPLLLMARVRAEGQYVDLPVMISATSDFDELVPSRVVLRVLREANEVSVGDLNNQYEMGDRSPLPTAATVLNAIITGDSARYAETAKLTDDRKIDDLPFELSTARQFAFKDALSGVIHAIYRVDATCLVTFTTTHTSTSSFGIDILYGEAGQWKHWPFHGLDPLYQTIARSVEPEFAISPLPARDYSHSVRYPAPGAEPNDEYATYVMFDGVVPVEGARVFGGKRGGEYIPADLPETTPETRVLVAFRRFIQRAATIYPFPTGTPRDEAAWNDARGLLSGGALAEWDELAAGDGKKLANWISTTKYDLRVILLMNQGPSWRVWYRGRSADRVDSLEMAEIDGEYRIIHALGMKPDIAVHTSDVVRNYVKGLAGEE